MKRSLLVSGAGVLMICTAILASLKLGDLIVGMIVPNSRIQLQSARSIILREHSRNESTVIRPRPTYVAGTDGLQARDFVLRTDDNGFILGPATESGPVDIIFMGGSTTECMLVDEGNRFPAFTATLLRRSADGSPVRTLNAGVGGNHSLHTTLNLIAKVLPLKPRMVVIMHNANDLALLMNTGSYWSAPSTRALIQQPGSQAWRKSFRSLAKSVRDFLIPNAWNVLATHLPGLTAKLAGVADDDEFADFRTGKPDVSQITEDFRASMTGAVALLRAWGIEPVLMTQFNRLDGNDAFVNRQLEKKAKSPIPLRDYVAYYAKFNDVVREIARDSGVLLIDLDRLVPRSKKYIYDAFHLNDAGSRLVAEIVAREIARKSNVYELVPQS